MLNGGLLPGRPYLIVGPSGTGKTKLALRFLCEGVRRGESVLIVTLEEPPNEMKVNHRGMGPDLDRVYVFDAIPDVMRYERAPFKDIAAVRSSSRFSETSDRIRQSPELASVEVTFTALEQTLKMEVARRSYKRLVIDSLTALQYFCMKGFDEVVGAQSFLRFLSDLRITTLLTVEAPIEDVESPERQLARGEIRLFRWDLDGRTVRAIGVEKIRGSPHDVRLHPYRITPDGIEIQLRETISRDTRQIVEGLAIAPELTRVPAPPPEVPAAPAAPLPALDLGSFEQEVSALAAAGADLSPVRTALAAAVSARARARPDAAARQVERAAAISHALLAQLRGVRPSPPGHDGGGTVGLSSSSEGRSDPAVLNLSPAALEASWPRVERLLATTSPGAVAPPPAAAAPAAPLPAAPAPPAAVAASAPRPPPPFPVPSGPTVVEVPPKSGRPITRAASRIASALGRGGPTPPRPTTAGAPPIARPEPTPTPPAPPLEPVGSPSELPMDGGAPQEQVLAEPPTASSAVPLSSHATATPTVAAHEPERPPLPTPVLIPARAPVVVRPVPGASAPSATNSGPEPSPSVVEPVLPDSPAKRKTRAPSTASRKRSPKRAAPASAVVDPSVPSPPTPASGGAIPLSEPGGTAEVVPKVKRRQPRKKKAPTVEGAVAATPLHPGPSGGPTDASSAAPPTAEEPAPADSPATVSRPADDVPPASG